MMESSNMHTNTQHTQNRPGLKYFLFILSRILNKAYISYICIHVYIHTQQLVLVLQSDWLKAFFSHVIWTLFTDCNDAFSQLSTSEI